MMKLPTAHEATSLKSAGTLDAVPTEKIVTAHIIDFKSKIDGLR
jgi:hypothetical protein